MPERLLSTIFFDVGGTLFTAEPPVEVIFKEACEEFGYGVDVRALPMAFIHAEKRTRVHAPRTPAEEKAYFLEYNVHAMAHLGFTITPEESRSINQAFNERLVMDVYGDVAGVLQTLREDGKLLAIVSNEVPSIRTRLEEVGLTAHFDEMVLSSEVGASKPDPRIFETALRRTASDPRTTAHVGDTYEVDVVGAQSAGILPVLIDRRRRHDSPDCLVIRDLRELLDLV